MLALLTKYPHCMLTIFSHLPSRTMSSDNHRSLHLSPSSSTTNHSTIYEKDDVCSASTPLHATAETRKSLGSESSTSTPLGGQRSTRALLTRQTLFTPLGTGSSFDAFAPAGNGGSGGLGGGAHSPAQCVHGALMRTASSNFSCPVHGSQAHLCSTEARLLSRANKILMYVHLPLLRLFFYFYYVFNFLYIH